MTSISSSSGSGLARLAAALLLPVGLMASPGARADSLDFVLDVLYKAGVVDGNVKAAKPLISCLATGKSVPDCTIGAAGQTELASDPQVQNVIDIYHSYEQQDWYAVLKKSGITVGCALIPGGEVKDIVCGELGKIAGAVLDGAGSVVGAVGGFIGSMFGGGSDSAPMSEEDYYRLNFMPWYHWSVVHQLDEDTPASNQVLNAPFKPCVEYFDSHRYSLQQAVTACSNLRTRLGNSGYAIGNAFRQETDSYYQLHFAPKLYEWAEMSFGNDNINIYAKQAMNTCVADERTHIPLPNPGFDQCQAMKEALASLPPIVQDTGNKLYAQCQAQANARAVPADNDAYTRICKPMVNRIIGKVIFVAMADLKSSMNKAAAAGCPNTGTPKSILCDSFPARAACVKAIPEHASMCALDYDRAVSGLAQIIVDAVSSSDRPCRLDGRRIACVHPTQQVNCNSARQAIGDAWGPSAIAGIACEPLEDADYDQLRQKAQTLVSTLNGSYAANPTTSPPCQGAACQDQMGGHLLAPGPSIHGLTKSGPTLQNNAPIEGCSLARRDPLVVNCAASFHWDANAERAMAVYEILGSTGVYCPFDEDRDGADAPCISGGPTLSPAVDSSRPRPAPVNPVRLHRLTPIRADGGG